jgi:hypothetical protein
MTNQQSTAPPEPITPDYDRVPEHPVSAEAVAEPIPEPAPAEAAKQQRKAKAIPRHKRKLQRKRKPRKYDEWDSPQFRHDQQLLDLQLRIGSLRDFLKSHDLWTVFTDQNKWW